MSTDTIKRRKTIIDMLYSDGSVNVTTLSRRFNVSQVIIR
ncbi:MAG TPA: DeoR family transcriptional regulator [Arsenophonus sp.]